MRDQNGLDEAGLQLLGLHDLVVGRQAVQGVRLGVRARQAGERHLLLLLELGRVGGARALGDGLHGEADLVGRLDDLGRLARALNALLELVL